MRREMPDLIDREWVLKNLFFDVDMEVVRKAPAVDAVEVVRCKECVMWTPNRIGSIAGKCPFYIGNEQCTRYDHYCACGGRRKLRWKTI
ncbi:MAG: hypothetical protein ACI4WX_00830 [Aristaeellaceae bacterium]